MRLLLLLLLLLLRLAQDQTCRRSKGIHQRLRLKAMQHMLVTEAAPGASPRSRARMAVEYMEPTADKVVAEKISGACRTIRSFCPKILKPKDRMTTPSMLMSQFPAPHTSGLCIQRMKVSRYLAVRLKEPWGDGEI